MGGGVVVLLVGVGSGAAFTVTSAHCDTNPQGDTSSSWQFSSYCRALHSAHVFNYPGTVSGGGFLEGVFVLPVLVALGGLILALRLRRVEPLWRALYVSGALVALLFGLALTLASATYHAF